MALSPRSIRSVLAVMLSCGAIVFFTASPVLAHDALKSSSPAKDAKVASVKEITLEYTGRVRFPFVVLHDKAGRTVGVGAPRLAGTKVFADVTQPVRPGSYVIGWRVVSSDGHPIEGEIPFTVIAPASGTKTAAAMPAATLSLRAQASSTPGSAAAEEPRSVPGWLWVAAAGLVVIGAGVWLRSRRTPPNGREAGPGA